MSDTKKEAYRKYLESAGVVDALTKVLVSLYEETDKPKDAIEYIKKVLGGPTSQEHEEVLELKADLQKQLEQVTEELNQLKIQVS